MNRLPIHIFSIVFILSVITITVLLDYSVKIHNSLHISSNQIESIQKQKQLQFIHDRNINNDYTGLFNEGPISGFYSFYTNTLQPSLIDSITYIFSDEQDEELFDTQNLNSLQISWNACDTNDTVSNSLLVSLISRNKTTPDQQSISQQILEPSNQPCKNGTQWKDSYQIAGLDRNTYNYALTIKNAGDPVNIQIRGRSKEGGNINLPDTKLYGRLYHTLKNGQTIAIEN